MPIHQIYGLSECSGPLSVGGGGPNRPLTVGNCGRALGGTEMKIRNSDANGNGEVCCRGRHAMMGYLDDPEATAATIDGDGWLLTGDIGRIHADMSLTITGRIKDIIVLASGENIAPEPIEHAIKEVLPFVENCVVIGNRRAYLSALLTIGVTVDDDGAPTACLSARAMAELAVLGIEAHSVVQAVEDPILARRIDAALRIVNATSSSSANRIKRWAFLPRDFSLQGGELGPTLKLRRFAVERLYQSLIAQLYEPFQAGEK